MTSASLAASDLAKLIDALWDRRTEISSKTSGADRDAVDQALSLLEAGEARVAEPTESGWQVNQWLKKAVLLSFRLQDSVPMPGPGGAPDKRCPWARQLTEDQAKAVTIESVLGGGDHWDPKAIAASLSTSTAVGSLPNESH